MWTGVLLRKRLAKSRGFLAALSSFVVLCVFTTQIGTVHAQYGTIAGAWKVRFDDVELRLGTKERVELNVAIYDVDLSGDVDFYFQAQVENTKLALVDTQVQRSELIPMPANGKAPSLAHWQGVIPVQGNYFGYTQLFLTLRPAEGAVERSTSALKVVVLRAEHVDGKIYTYSAASVVLLMFLNLGTVLDLRRLKSILLRPIGPFIGFCTRYMLMPALGLGMGQLFFGARKELQVALFFTALAPSGGLANICAVFLKGNIHLSIATTTINSLLAMAMLPLWIYAVARVVYDDATLTVPLLDLALGSAGLIAAIALGAMMRICIPKTTKFIFRLLKPLSLVLSLCLIALTVAINAFVFKELTLMIVLAAFFLPLVGYLLSFLVAKLCRRSPTDSLTIAIETSVLNMTVPIVLLQTSFDQPRLDQTLVVPIMATIISIILATGFYTVRRIFGWNEKGDPDAYNHKELLISKGSDTTNSLS